MYENTTCPNGKFERGPFVVKVSKLHTRVVSLYNSSATFSFVRSKVERPAFPIITAKKEVNNNPLRYMTPFKS